MCLLVLRVGTYESNLFKHAQADTAVSRGNFLQLFTSRRRFFKYLACIGVGVPIWFSVGILVLLAKEFATIIGVHGIAPEALNRTAIMWCYVGLAVGDILAGLLSQIVGSRRKVVAGFVLAHALSILVYLVCARYFGNRIRHFDIFRGRHNGLLGFICHHCHRAVRHQYSGYGCHYSS